MPRAPVKLVLLGLLLSALPCQNGHAQEGKRPSLARHLPMFYQHDAGQIQPVKTPDDWQKRRQSILAAMQSVMGPLPNASKRCPLDLRVEEEVDCGDYVRRRITYASEPGQRVPAYLLVPKTALAGQSRLPGVLCLHQTHPSGSKVVVGLGKSPDDEYGVELVKRGYVCLAPPYPLLADYSPDLKNLGYQSGTMKAIWDNLRGLDLLESLPYVEKGRFGAIGHSLGGHNAVFTAVFDQRLKVIVSSCGLDSFKDYMDGNLAGWSSVRYMPLLKNYSADRVPFDFHEMIAALASRACLISAPVGDTNFKWRSVDAVAAAAKPVYALLGQPGNLQVVHPDCGHLFPPETRTLAYRLLDRELKGSAGPGSAPINP